jgi:hypothetical protein
VSLAPAKLPTVRYYEYVGLVLAVTGTACWAICFWWMHRISARQDTMLQELHEVARRIESLAKEEHDLIAEVHPAVAEIKESVADVAVAVAADQSVSRAGGS